MDEPMDETSQWQSVRERIMRLEQENDRLRSWGWRSFVLNVLILVGALYWLARPDRMLETERLSAADVRTGRIFELRTRDERTVSYNGLNSSGVLQTVHGGWASANFELIDTTTPWFTMQNIFHGELVTLISDAPRLYFWKDARRSGPNGDRTGIELLLEGPSQSPRFVLRDANNQVIWQAP